jgi:hypothetical protein
MESMRAQETMQRCYKNYVITIILINLLYVNLFMCP